MANLGQIEEFLKSKKIKYKVREVLFHKIDLAAEIFRVEDVIAAGVNPEEVVKTLIVKTSVIYPPFKSGS